LKLNKFRQMYNNFTVEGDKMVVELLQDAHTKIESIICSQEWYDEKALNYHLPSAKVWIAKPKELEQITALKTASAAMAVVQQPNWKAEATTVQQDLSLYLDRIQNPGNLGTILRIADWFGIRHVFCSMDSVELYNPKVIQSTMGAFLRVRCIKIDFEQLVDTYPALPIYGTILEGENLFESQLEANGLIVIGNEGSGISPAIKAKITHPLSIPSHAAGGAESLNAAVATGIVCAMFRNLK